MKYQRLENILENIPKTKIGVIGDFCLDAYWILDTGTRELSVETGKPTYAVTEQIYSLGGAGNVAQNLVDIGVAEVCAFTVLGEDLFGREIWNLFTRNRIHTPGVITQEKNWQTAVYAKPYWKEEELDRIDFGKSNNLSSESENRMIQVLEMHLPELDALIVNQQLPKSIYSDNLIQALNELVIRYPLKYFILNTRQITTRFTNYICRLNDHEAAQFCGKPRDLFTIIPEKELQEYARQIFHHNLKPVFITRGGNGVLVYDGNQYLDIPGIQVSKPIDSTGAGDTGVSAMTAALGAGASLEESAEIGNLASAVTVQKLRQTGTAKPNEILELLKQQS